MGERRKSSYYVLFLGAKESKGLRGSRYIEPVLEYFISQEAKLQALKVTLQVSYKGIKIIPCNQRIVVGNASVTDAEYGEKHFIPHHAITCVFQGPPPNDDVVSCILLIYNPDTKCPVHVHCYRCDSPETATILRDQLEMLVSREDNQKKFRDIESRLESKGLLPSSSSPSRRDRGTPEFDCRTSDSSENSDRGFGSGSGTSNLTSDRIATMYDSLAAELRERLNTNRRNTPILLPPRDYDTMHRQRGNLSGIESRRCSNPAVVGPSGFRKTRRSYASREQESCGRSSGIGSAEDNSSPLHDAHLDSHAAPSSSDDEDWSPTQLVATENTQFLVRPIWPGNNSGAMRSSSPAPPPLPKRREYAPRTGNALTSSPPAPVFSRERFEGVRQKWERRDHQYVRQRSHDSLDEGYRSREPAETDYRRQLSRESLLRSLGRSKGGSKESLDRWVENGMRSLSIWKKEEERIAGGAVAAGGSRTPPLSHQELRAIRNGRRELYAMGSGLEQVPPPPASRPPAMPSPLSRTRTDVGKKAQREISEYSYRELSERERYPGLDKETARSGLHASSSNIHQQHIYSEPTFDNLPPPPPPAKSSGPTKSKKFSFAFWK